MRNLLTPLALLLLSPLPCAASDVDDFTYLFARTCMQNFYAPENLSAQMADNTVLEGESAKFFLGGANGTAWAINDGDAKYVVALRQDKVCAVFAQQASVDEVTRNFVASVSVAPSPLVAVERSKTGQSGPQVRTLACSWAREQDRTELLFTLTTSNEDNPPVKAMASMALVAK